MKQHHRSPNLRRSGLRMRRGSLGKTALALVGLGMGSAVFGATIVGPYLSRQLEPASAKAPRPEKQEQLASHEPATAPEETPSRNLNETPSSTEAAPDSKSVSVSERAAKEGWDEPDLPEEGSARPGEAPERTPAPERPAGEETKSEPAEEAPRPAETSRPTSSGSHRTPSAAETRPLETPSDRKEERRSSERSTVRTRERREERGAGEESRSEREPKGTRSRDREHPKTTAVASEPSDRGKKNDPKPATEKSTPSEEPNESVYRVRAGRFTSREDADKARAALAESGTDATVVSVGRSYRLQLGAFKRKANAEKSAEQLKGTPYRADITEGPKGESGSGGE